MAPVTAGRSSAYTTAPIGDRFTRCAIFWHPASAGSRREVSSIEIGCTQSDYQQ